MGVFVLEDGPTLGISYSVFDGAFQLENLSTRLSVQFDSILEAYIESSAPWFM